MEDWTWPEDGGVKMRGGGGRGAGGAAASAARAASHFWRMASAFSLAAAVSLPFSILRTRSALSWPGVGRREEWEEEEEAAEEAGAGEKAREERRVKREGER